MHALILDSLDKSVINDLRLDPAFGAANVSPYQPLAILQMVSVLCTTGTAHDTEDVEGLLVRRTISIKASWANQAKAKGN